MGYGGHALVQIAIPCGSAYTAGELAWGPHDKLRDSHPIQGDFMNRICRTVSHVASVALLSTGLAFTQTEEATPEAKAAAPVAYVYVGSTNGVELYDAAPNGQLTSVKGSPYPTSGLAVGSNGSSFITLGTYYVHSYSVSSTGTIGKQVSDINTQDYPDNGICDGQPSGTIGLANLDHTGHNLYVLFPLDIGGCSASIQTYNIAKSGDLTFNGGIMTGGNAGYGLYQAPTIIGNDTFAYAASEFECCGGPPGWSGYIRESHGEMQNLTFNFSEGNTDPFGYVPFYVTAGPTNHLAAIVAYNYGEEQYDPAQLASYTADAKGNLSTTMFAARWLEICLCSGISYNCSK